MLFPGTLLHRALRIQGPVIHPCEVRTSIVHRSASTEYNNAFGSSMNHRDSDLSGCHISNQDRRIGLMVAVEVAEDEERVQVERRFVLLLQGVIVRELAYPSRKVCAHGGFGRCLLAIVAPATFRRKSGRPETEQQKQGHEHEPHGQPTSYNAV